MAEWAKMAIKIGLVAVVMGAIWLIFQVQFPTLDFSYVTLYGSKAMAILDYWIPGFNIIWSVTLVLLGILLALWVFRFSSVGWRWMFKVNE